jgi:hypothetical protein
MVYYTEIYWVSGLCPSCGIIKNINNATVRKLDLFPSSGEEVGDTYSVGFVRKSQAQNPTFSLFKYAE